MVVRVKALEALLTEKGLVDPQGLDTMIDMFEHKIGPHVGAKAWTDPAFKVRLLADANAVIAEMSIARIQTEDLAVLENTPDLHNVIVCTLCSYYPWGVLGLPPNWYKSTPYRSRIVREPRAVLQEFGCEVPPTKEIRVWDSTAELRYMVLPERPADTEGLNEDQLAALVTRDSMIGVGIVSAAAAAA